MMADALKLTCAKHKVYVWIGQLPYGEPERAYLYTVPDEAQKQQRFIRQHALCAPTILNDAALEELDADGDFTEFEGA